MKPFESSSSTAATTRPSRASASSATSRASSAPWRRPARVAKDANALVEAFPTVDGASQGRRRARSSARSRAPRSSGTGRDASAASRPEDRDFVHAVYSNFPTCSPSWSCSRCPARTRAFRSLMLPMKAAVLNLVSLGGRLRDHRLHLPAGPRLGGDLGRARDAVDHPVDPADDLRVPLRPLDGLRGLHAHADARGLRRDRRHADTRSRSASRAPASS